LMSIWLLAICVFSVQKKNSPSSSRLRVRPPGWSRVAAVNCPVRQPFLFLVRSNFLQIPLITFNLYNSICLSILERSCLCADQEKGNMQTLLVKYVTPKFYQCINPHMYWPYLRELGSANTTKHISSRPYCRRPWGDVL
jgi:hypothetical protein